MGPRLRDNLLRMTEYRPGLFVQYTRTFPGIPHSFQKIITREEYEAEFRERGSRPDPHHVDRVYMRFSDGDVFFFDTSGHFPYGLPEVFTREQAIDKLDKYIREAQEKRDALSGSQNREPI